MSPATLAERLPTYKRIQIFCSLIQDVDQAWRRLSDERKHTIVLAPLNSAMRDLPEKPWKQAGEIEALGAQAYSGEEGTLRAQSNLKAWVESHLLEASEWKEGSKVKSIAEKDSKEVWWEQTDSGKIVSIPNAVTDYLDMLTSLGSTRWR